MTDAVAQHWLRIRNIEQRYRNQMTKRITAWTVVAIIGLTAPVMAQSSGTPSSQSSDNMRSAPSNAAGSANRDRANDEGAPRAGANSFTESQARSRIESHGYQQVGQLKKDDQSIWHAQAQKAGKPVEVELDYKGNVVEK